MPEQSIDLPQGTLDLLILRTLALHRLARREWIKAHGKKLAAAAWVLETAWGVSETH